MKYNYTQFNETLLDIMQAYNSKNSNSEAFTLVDARIISLIYFYNANNKQFLESNEYLAAKCMTTKTTIQKSINKLLSHSLITKRVHYINGRKCRVLTYQSEAVEQFKRTVI